ncbi:MAG: NADH:flavin oxidoreductases, Old Yellow Enzyme family [uncultured Acetobacteraceae bacterium]|uniref:NADH:flavin oxidoreductases, Old Yellow Enzyme family n=1 Tax=uncultured Acetobacteraceae bacterium TaxID=169975 RepID=A0A6J4HX70_9PROT|nr:MAG: NADH:flavin oxidoreductases, Old Yellow Enzyme family [uncultured Acetobacteraceae bacterium]
MSNDNAAAELFQPVRMGALTLPNRVVMAPLTRSRAGAGDVQGPLNATYYAQRASAGLIISEATNITQQGKGYAFTPGIWSDEQVAGWRSVTDAVHARGGRIVCQLWHVGRISHPSLQPNGALPVAPSAVQPKGNAFTETGFQPHVTPRALETDEIAGIVSDYRHAAEQAKRAGFDGVEIHAANGYLIDQFLRDGTNKRTDRYGGSVENRLRLLLEVTEIVTGVWGGERTGLRLSPVSPANDISDSDPMAVFGPAVDAVNRFNLAYVHFVEGATGGDRNVAPDFDFAALRRAFNGLTMMNNGYDRDLAVSAVREGRADLIAFGRPYIANPDLVERLRSGAPLAKPDNATFYGGDAHGYTDYPALGEEQLNAA